ncbi:hypothetical protein GCM10009127_14130 [Alteraurantiacibacter aestuarii]|uniref:hypothetical protein n=1 Tax=Alteraurantiacibacter aestuarii TaxID=650004 RepID=UPI001926FE1D|nr:hypothetical protein [Alteraurantiacibacter aestuarii]
MILSLATRRTGIWSAAASLAFSLAYIIAQLFEWAGMLGSGGGPNASSTALGIFLLLAPSLLLGPAFVVLCAALHVSAPADRKVFTLAGLAFAIMYATLTGMVYFVQLTFVAPRIASGETAGIELLLFVPYESFLFAIDLLGYSLMSAATLIAAFGLPLSSRAKFARFAMIANGAILPFLALQMAFPVLIWPAAAWAITFPLAMAAILNMFRATAQGEQEP